MPLLEAKEITKAFPIKTGFFGRTTAKVHALNGVSLSVEAGQTVGLVGESGCGKSTLARILMRLIAPSSGKVFFEGEETTALPEKKLRPLRRKFQMVFQDPYASLNPRMTVGQTLTEPLKVHSIANASERKARVFNMLAKVGLNQSAYYKYPHEFSGGQRQRVGIARALMLLPKLIVADEAVSALDVSIQAQIINLLMDLQEEFKLTYLFIAHDLKVVRHLSEKIVVMYLGHVMEILPAAQLAQAKHPYTQALLSAVPDPHTRTRDTQLLAGEIPSPMHPPSGCVFRTRCPYAIDACAEAIPPLENLTERHQAACILLDKIPEFSNL